jgi:hypothetical protein
MMATYFATKAFVLSFSEALNCELENKGVLVSCLCPGPTHSDFSKTANVENSLAFKYAMEGSEVAKTAYKQLITNQAVTIAGTTGTSAPDHTVGLAFNGTATLAYAGNSATINSTNAAVCALMQTISVGKYVTISSSTTAGNNGTYLVTKVVGNGTSTGIITVLKTDNFTAESAASGTTVKLRTLFVDEIAPKGSSSVNKYISKAIKLENPSNFFRIRLATNCPSESDILVYYKTSPVGSTQDVELINWTLSSPDAAIKKVQNGDGTFYDVDYSEENLVPFDSIAVKIVMQSTNSSAPPRIKDLRIIACA